MNAPRSPLVDLIEALQQRVAVLEGRLAELEGRPRNPYAVNHEGYLPIVPKPRKHNPT